MAVTTIQSNNKLVQYVKEINREFVRENLFSPYMGSDLNAIIRVRQELKNGGEQMNIPLVSKLTNAGIGVGTLVGNEEKIDNYGMRVWLDWNRNAVVSNKAEVQKDSTDLFGEAKSLLSDWGKEIQRDEIIEAFMALPSESAPANLGTGAGQRVNGIMFAQSTVAQRNTWTSDNQDHVLFGALISNYSSGVFATALGTLDTTNDILNSTNVSLLKRQALQCSPAVRPYKTNDGYEYYVLFVGVNAFRDLKANLQSTHTTALQNTVKNNVIFQDGDLLWDGVIVRQVPEISGMVTDQWSAILNTAGASSTRVEPAFLCGQQAMAFCWGQMARPTERKEDDYGFVTGVGIDMAYGVAKMFKKVPMTGTALKQWGVVSGFFSSAADA